MRWARLVLPAAPLEPLLLPALRRVVARRCVLLRAAQSRMRLAHTRAIDSVEYRARVSAALPVAEAIPRCINRQICTFDCGAHGTPGFGGGVVA